MEISFYEGVHDSWRPERMPYDAAQVCWPSQVLNGYYTSCMHVSCTYIRKWKLRQCRCTKFFFFFQDCVIKSVEHERARKRHKKEKTVDSIYSWRPSSSIVLHHDWLSKVTSSKIFRHRCSLSLSLPKSSRRIRRVQQYLLCLFIWLHSYWSSVGFFLYLEKYTNTQQRKREKKKQLMDEKESEGIAYITNASCD